MEIERWLSYTQKPFTTPIISLVNPYFPFKTLVKIQYSHKHETRMKTLNAYEIMLGKLDGMRPLNRPLGVQGRIKLE